MPTRELEGFGLSTIEALACGTPVIATPVGANPEVLRPLHPALIARGKSPAALAEAVIDVWRRPALLKEIQRRGRDHVVQAAGWDSVARRYLDVYRELAPRVQERSRRWRAG
jgi:glycosyltransferase involved in cell wall biosynthesis